MKRFSEEDIREYSLVAIICIGLFLVAVLTPIQEIMHEGAHSYSCELQGGIWKAEPTDTGYHTVCKGVENWTGQDAVNFYLAGMGGEIGISLIFLLSPMLSILGSFLFINVGLSMLTGAYATDFAKTCEVAPNLCFLQNPVFQGIFLAIGFVLIAVSFFYTRKMVKKLNLFGPL